MGGDEGRDQGLALRIQAKEQAFRARLAHAQPALDAPVA